MAEKTLKELLYKYLPPPEFEAILSNGIVTRSRVDKEKRFLEVAAYFPYIISKQTLYALEDEIRQADIVITGEGCVDKTSAYGKVFSGIGRTAKKYGVPVFGFAGKLKEGYEAVYDAGISSVIATPDSPMPMRVAMSEAPRLISAAAERTARVLKVGMEMGK